MSLRSTRRQSFVAFDLDIPLSSTPGTGDLYPEREKTIVDGARPSQRLHTSLR